MSPIQPYLQHKIISLVEARGLDDHVAALLAHVPNSNLRHSGLIVYVFPFHSHFRVCVWVCDLKK